MSLQALTTGSLTTGSLVTGSLATGSLATGSLRPVALNPVPTNVVSLEQVLERILMTRQIGRTDQHLLLAQSCLTAREEVLLNQVFDRLQTGRIKVVD